MKRYVNQKTQMTVLSGRVLSVAADRLSAVIKTQRYDQGTKKYNDEEIVVTSQYPLSAEITDKKNVTAVGYATAPVDGKPAINAQSFTANEACFESQDIAVVSGHIANVKMNEEKTEDGSAKLTREGKPKKPHLDITVIVNEKHPASEDIVPVRHTIKIYNFENEQQNADEKSNIEKAKARLKNFENAEDTPTYISIVTKAGSTRVWESENGPVYFSDHLGFSSIDTTYEFSLNKEKENTPAAPSGTDAPAPSQAIGGSNPPVEEEEEVPFN